MVAKKTNKNVNKIKLETPKNKGGRKTVITEEVVSKLITAFELGCTDMEACLFADISPKTLYNFQNANPEFLERKELAKQRTILKARQVLISNIQTPTPQNPNGNGDLALKYLERKARDEFAPKSTLDVGVSEELSQALDNIKLLTEQGLEEKRRLLGMDK